MCARLASTATRLWNRKESCSITSTSSEARSRNQASMTSRGRRFIGDTSKIERILLWLDLRQKAEKQGS